MNQEPEKNQKEEKTDGVAAPEPKAAESGKDLFVKMNVAVPSAEIHKQIDEVARGYASDIKLPGFRKGNVPVDIIKNRYKQLISDEALNKLIEVSVYEKIQQDKLRIVSRPIVEKIDYQEGSDLKADVRVELFPEITCPDFSSLELKIPAKELISEPFNEKKEIDAVLERNKRRVPIKTRPVKENDMLILVIQSKFLETKRMIKKKEATFLANRESQFEIPDLADEVIGKNLNDRIRVKRKYPADHPTKKWAGKELEHDILIKNIFEMHKAELNDEFLKSLGLKAEEDFKKKLREEYDLYIKNQKEEKISGFIIDRLTSTMNFPTPRTLLEGEMLRVQAQYAPILKTLDEKQKKEYLDSLKTNVERSVRFSLILDFIQREFKLEISNEELEKEYKLIAENNQFPLAEVRKYYLNSEEKEKLKDALLRVKVMQFLKEKIKIKEV